MKYKRTVPCNPALPTPGCSAARRTTRRNSWVKARLADDPPLSRYQWVASSASASASELNDTCINQRALSIIASSRAKTSSAGIQTVFPASMSATRRAISSSHALAMASGESSASLSKLTIRRRINSHRSLGVRLNAWSAISFNIADMMPSLNSNATGNMIAPLP